MEGLFIIFIIPSTKISMLEFPITLRLASLDDLSANSHLVARLEQAKTANIVPGYVVVDKTGKQEGEQELPFKFYAQINVNNTELWELIQTLSNALPKVAALIFNDIDSGPNYGKYLDKYEILMDLTPYKKELIEDTFLEWGLIYQDKNRLIEIFISGTKYVKFWGVDKEEFHRLMEQVNLSEIEDLEFIDEYPRVREQLLSFDEKVLDTHELIELFLSKYVD
jgi:hypothetical protein